MTEFEEKNGQLFLATDHDTAGFILGRAFQSNLKEEQLFPVICSVIERNACLAFSLVVHLIRRHLTCLL